MTETLLQLQDVKKHFPVTSGLVFGRVQALVKAVDGVSLASGKGETLGLVGESGCGKTTMARLILRQEEVTSGSITFHGRDLAYCTSATCSTIASRCKWCSKIPIVP